MDNDTEILSTKKVHIRICTGHCKNHGGWHRPVYVYPQIRVCLFFWRTLWDCPYCQNYQVVKAKLASREKFRFMKKTYIVADHIKGVLEDLEEKRYAVVL